MPQVELHVGLGQYNPQVAHVLLGQKHILQHGESNDHLLQGVLQDCVHQLIYISPMASR